MTSKQTETNIQSIQELLTELRALGIQLWLENDQLRYKAPKNALTPEKLSQLKTHKSEILAFLRQSESSSKSKSESPSITPRENQGSIPLSFAQQRLWFLGQLEPDSPFYNIATAVHLSGHLNHQALQRALNTIVERHEVLRTTYTAENGNPVQVINPPQTVELLTINLQQYQDKEQEIQLQTILNRESQRPFNLSSDLMLRGCLLQLADNEYVLLLVMHHIASDGWSIGVLWNELETLYKAFIEEKAEQLPALSIQYADYAVWQRNWLSGEVLEKQLNYWKEQLADANPVLELPTDRPRPAVQTYRGASKDIAVSRRLTEDIKALCRQEGVTLYMLLLATFQVLLYRYTRQEDIIVGSPIAGRNREEIEGLIGFFVNTLVFRTDLAGNPSFKEVLDRVKTKTLEAYAHQDLPFDRLVEELSPERSLSYNPLFQVMFVLQNAFTETEMLSGLKKSPVEMDKDTAKFDLTLSISEDDGGLIGHWEYSTDLFDGSTIERMAGHFGTLLEGIVANPNESVASLPLLGSAELHQILIEWNDTATDYPKDQCVHQLFEAQAERTPEAIAVTFENQQLTYRQLNERANQLAHYLLSLNLDPQVLIGICVERSLEAIIGFLGILKAGGIYVPIDPAYPPERIALIIEDTQAPVLLTQETLGKNLPQHSGNTIYLDSDWGKINTSSTGNLACRTTPEDLAYIMYTSGSTGRPKGVCVRHKGIVRLVQNTNYADFSSEQIFLQLAPVSFDAATFEIWGALLNGARLILFPSRVPSLEELGQAIKQYQVTILWLTSGLFHLMVDEKLEDLASLQQLLAGGDVLSVTHIRKFLKKVDGCKLINGYGPTENTTFTCCHLIDSLEENCQSVPIGKPIANTQVYLLDKYFNPVPTGVVGELYTGGDGLATGYFQRPDLTEDKFIDNPLKKSSFANLDRANYSDRLYKTGDLARYLPDGTIEFLGRIDNQVKIRGFRIELGEIEGIIAEHPSVKQSIVLVREKSPGDKYIVAYVVCQSQQSSVDPQKLSDFIKEKLPNYMVPAAIVLLDEFPLTPNGKIDRRALPEPDFVKSNLSTNFVAPQTPLEQQIADIWVKALNINQVGIHDNFFELGGHSLLAVQVFSEIEKTWNTKLPLSILFNAPSIHELAKAIQNQDQSSSPASSIVAIQPKGKKTPVFGIHAIGTSVQFYRGLAEYLGEDQPFYGLQSRFLDYASPDLTLEDMAAIYIEDIKTIQAEGPYLLTGYSFGGRVVYEMAQQLMKSDIEVALLAIIDAPAPGGFQRLPWNEYLVEHWKNLRAFGIDYAVRKISTQFNLRTLQLRKFINKRDQSKKADTNTAEFFKNRLRQIEALHQQVLDNYQFKEYPGTVTLFKSDTKPDNVGDKWEPTLGWQYFAKGGVEIHDIPGTHRNIFNEPNIQIFAKKFSSCINKALEK